MYENMMEEIENMTAEEQQALLETQFPEEMEKMAAAEIATGELTEALYAYGWLSAERAVAEHDGLDKIASEALEEHEAAEAQVGAIIEAALETLGTAYNEDEVGMHKEAQAAAAVIFEGYSDALEKIAKSKPSKGFMAKMKAYYGKAKKHVGAHSGKYGLGAGAAAGLAGGYMSKKASDMTLGEIVDVVQSVNEVEAGLEKIAKRGAAKGKGLWNKIKGHYGTAKKHVGKHSGKYGLGAGAAGGAVAGRMLADRD